MTSFIFYLFDKTTLHLGLVFNHWNWCWEPLGAKPISKQIHLREWSLLCYWEAWDSSAGCYLIHDEYIKKYIEGSHQFYFSGLQSETGAHGTTLLLKREKTTLLLYQRVNLDFRLSHSSPRTDGYWQKEHKLVWMRINVRNLVGWFAASSEWWYAGTRAHTHILLLRQQHQTKSTTKSTRRLTVIALICVLHRNTENCKKNKIK